MAPAPAKSGGSGSATLFLTWANFFIIWVNHVYYSSDEDEKPAAKKAAAPAAKAPAAKKEESR